MTDRDYLNKCLIVAEKSNDPSTKVGAIIVGPSGNYCCGYNRFPCGIINLPERWNDRDVKIKLVVHAEIAALLNALKAKFHLDKSILYMWATDVKTGATWGGPPCTRCAVELIQAGIGEIRVPVSKGIPERWLADLNLSRELILEAGIKYVELD